MKKLLLVGSVLLGFCALGQVARADGYYRHGYGRGYGYHRGHYYGRYYGGYGFYGPGPFFATGLYFAPPPPVYYCPPPRPAYYEGRIEREEAPPRYDNSK